MRIARVLVFLAACPAMAGPVEVMQPGSVPEPTMLDQIRQLEGTWELQGPDGKPETGSVFQVTASGSAVREIMFPGGKHEMTNIYHMDGNTLVMTHYCAIGNQPRLRVVSARPGLIEMKTEAVGNRQVEDEPYMAELVLRFPDKETLIQEWRSAGGDKPETAVFEMKRVLAKP